jgi:hypothetical protein
MCTRREVDKANAAKLRELNTSSHVFIAEDIPGVNEDGKETKPDVVDMLVDRLPVPKSIMLKVCAPLDILNIVAHELH